MNTCLVISRPWIFNRLKIPLRPSSNRSKSWIRHRLRTFIQGFLSLTPILPRVMPTHHVLVHKSVLINNWRLRLLHNLRVFLNFTHESWLTPWILINPLFFFEFLNQVLVLRLIVKSRARYRLLDDFIIRVSRRSSPEICWVKDALLFNEVIDNLSFRKCFIHYCIMNNCFVLCLRKSLKVLSRSWRDAFWCLKSRLNWSKVWSWFINVKAAFHFFLIVRTWPRNILFRVLVSFHIRWLKNLSLDFLAFIISIHWNSLSNFWRRVISSWTRCVESFTCIQSFWFLIWNWRFRRFWN